MVTPPQGYHLELTLRRDEVPPLSAATYSEASIYARAEMRRYRYDGLAPDGLCQHVPVEFALNKLLTASTDSEAYGQLLSEQLFTGGLRDAWNSVRGYARSASGPLRCRLRLEDERLHGLRWELLRDPISKEPLVLSQHIHLARQFEARDQGLWARPEPSQLRALVAVANPTNLHEYGLDPININEETARALKALGNHISSECLGGTALRTTPEALERNLRKGFEIVYLVCHGAMSSDGVSSVFLEDADGSAKLVAGHTIYEIFQALDRQPALVVLAVCQSGGAADGVTSVTNSLGALLAKAGVPAVVAMQGLASFAMVATFIPELFTSLHLDGDVEQALAAARCMLRGQDTWWQPVLFTRLLDGQLWRVLEASIPFSQTQTASSVEVDISRGRTMADAGQNYQRQALQMRFDARRAEYEAVNAEIINSLDPISRVRLERQAENLLRELASLEKQLADLADAISKPSPSNPPAASSQISRRNMSKILERHFDLGELQALAFDLGVDYESLGGTTKPTKVIALIEYMERRSRFDELVAAVLRERPDTTF